MSSVSKAMFTCIAIACLLAVPMAQAQSPEAQGRAVLEQHKAAVVTVQLVVKTKMGMMGQSREEESKLDVTGAVIGPDGLTVLALSAMDPMGMVSQMMGGMLGAGMEMDSEVTDAQILLEDGSELPAQVILRDRELGLGFVRPREQPAKPMAYVDLSQAGEAQILEQVVALNRLGKVANRAYGANLERIQAVVEKPRTFYVPGQDPTGTKQGCPAFTLDGKVLGLVVMRTIKSDGGGGGMMGAMMGAMGGGNLTPIILPAADIQEAAEQAPAWGEASAEEPAEEEES